jgi:hypothetical protein
MATLSITLIFMSFYDAVSTANVEWHGKVINNVEQIRIWMESVVADFKEQPRFLPGET